MNLSKSLLTNI